MITTDSPRGLEPIAMPTQPDGTPYLYEMVDAAGAERTYANSITELLATLIAGYDTAATSSADQLRLQHAVDTQVRLQAQLCTDGPLEDCSEPGRSLLLGPRNEPPEPTGPWTEPIALVLVDTYYDPHSPRRRPTGVIIWLSPRDETTYLESLHAAGVISVAQLEGPGPLTRLCRPARSTRSP